jgi:hypothetical protein
VQVALGANSPYLSGKQLWCETRIALFELATDTRPDELKAQGGTPTRVVRRTPDHVDLRSLRGERPVLPPAAADLRGRGPGGGPTRRWRTGPERAAPPQRHDLPVEPVLPPASARSRRWPDGYP